jgi:hypothetical protein
VKADPTNAEWQRDLALSHAKPAMVYRKGGYLADAKEHLSAGRAIITPLLERVCELHCGGGGS